MVFLDLFKKQAQLHPDKILIQTVDSGISFKEFDIITSGIASQLLERGIADTNDANERTTVAINVGNIFKASCLLFGILKAGFNCALIHHEYNDEILQGMLARQEIDICISDYIIDADRFINVNNFDFAVNEKAVKPQARLTDENGKIITFTSGSTGRPKRTSLNEASALNFMNFFSGALDKDKIGTFLMSCSPAFSMGVINILMCTSFGYKLCASEQAEYYKNTFLLLKLMGDMSCDVIMTSTSFLDVIGSSKLFFNKLPRCLRLIFTGGECLKCSLLLRQELKARNIRLFNNYGTTETLGIANYDVDFEFISERDNVASVGKALPNLKISVFDEDGQTCVCKEGEIGVAFQFDNPLTKDKNEFFKTGDIGAFDENGMLHITGRADDYCKIRGFRINLKGIESALAQIPDVSNSLVFVKEAQSGNKSICAAIIDSHCDEGRIKKHLRDMLPEYMIPTKYKFYDAFPSTPSGKRDKLKIIKEFSDA